MPEQLAKWNSQRDVWETPEEPIFGPSDVYSETWPTSGSMRNGVAYELPTWEQRMDATESFCLLKTPTAQLGINGGSQHPDKRKAGGHGPTLADELEHLLLPTPAASDWKRDDYPADRLRKSPNITTVSAYFENIPLPFDAGKP